MSVIVTGAAGFIGFNCSRTLLERGEKVIGIDNLNDYYDPNLKRSRLEILRRYEGFTFHQANLEDRETILGLADRHPDVNRILHLAAQAGVRYSLQNPYAYVDSNLMGHVVMLELARKYGSALRSFAYASSSSVYGGNTKLPFSVDDPVEKPVSLYAATKRANELMSHTYAHLFGIPATGLRFFTVYGPWGRPDMAAFIFTKAIFEGRPISVFNHGEMRRDFTFIDDIVAGALAALDRPPSAADGAPHRVYNLGNHRSERLTDFIGVLERAIGKPAIKQLEDIQPGDVPATYADIEASRRDLGFEPTTSIEEGLPRFVQWYRDYYKV